MTPTPTSSPPVACPCRVDGRRRLTAVDPWELLNDPRFDQLATQAALRLVAAIAMVADQEA
jgi:hypothetical protein